MSDIKHKFVSTIPDGPDTTVVQPSNWNDEHVFDPPLPAGLIKSEGNGDFSGVVVDGLVKSDPAGNISGVKVQGLLQDPLGNGNIRGIQVRGILSDPLGDGNIVGIAPAGGGVISDPEGDGTYVGVKVTGLWNDDGVGHISGVRVKGLLNDKLGNGVYSGVDVDGVVIGQGENDYYGVTATQPGQVLRRNYKIATGGYEFIDDRNYVLATDYSFYTGATPSVALSAGVAATITIVNFPPGITSLSPNIHKILINDSVGGNEVILITAVNEAGKTITFTPAKNHAAPDWVMTSATNGIQEAFFATQRPYIQLPSGEIYQSATVTFWTKENNNVGGVVLAGNGIGITRLVRVSPIFDNGDVVRYDASRGAGYCLIKDLTIINSYGNDTPTGAGLHLTANIAGEGNVERVEVREGRQPILLDGNGEHTLNNVRAVIGTAYADAFPCKGTIESNTQIITLLNCTGYVASKNNSPWGFKFNRSVRTKVIGGTYAGTYAIQCETPADATVMRNVEITKVKIQDTSAYGIVINGTIASTALFNVSITDCDIVGPVVATGSGDGILVNGPVQNLIISRNHINGWGGAGINVYGGIKNPRGLIISNNCINNNSRDSGSGAGITIVCTGDASNAPFDIDCVITGNQCGNSIVNYATTTQVYGLLLYYGVAPQKMIGVTVVGNDFRGNKLVPVQIDCIPVMEKCIIANNGPLDEIYSSVASATVMTITPYSWFYVSGTVPIQKIAGGWPGRRVLFLFGDPAPGGFTSGIGQQNGVVRTITAIQNQTILLTFDGFHWF